MTQEKALELVQLINGTLKGTINGVVLNNLGVDTIFVAKATPDYRKDYYIEVEEQGGETTRQLTQTRLLSAMFDKAELYMRVFYNEEENELCFRVGISYHHTQGGSNGLGELLRFAINLDDPKTTKVF